ncbi:MAG: hypothetical protein AAB774_01940 [Patescibacteria group bacterium]
MSDWLNNNQGVLAGVGLLLVIGGYFFAKNKQVIKNKVSGSPHIKASRVQAGGDIIVGNKTINSNPHPKPDRPYIEIFVDGATSSWGEYEVKFGFRNVGNITAVLKKFTVADLNIHIPTKSITLNDPPVKVAVGLTNSRLRSSKCEGNVLKLEYEGLDGTRYATVASAEQELRADKQYNIRGVSSPQYIND